MATMCCALFGGVPLEGDLKGEDGIFSWTISVKLALAGFSNSANPSLVHSVKILI